MVNRRELGDRHVLCAQSYEAIMTSVRRGSSSALDCSGREAPFKRAAPCKGNPEGNLARKPRGNIASRTTCAFYDVTRTTCDLYDVTREVTRATCTPTT